MAAYHRKSFGLRKDVVPLLEAAYGSQLVDLLRRKGHQVTRGDLTVKLAREFGFCVGVERAVQMAYETRRKFPDKRIFIAAEIIHNAFVNEKLVEMGFIFLTGQHARGPARDDITPGDVVLLPAFGATLAEIRGFQERGALIVDTTCGAVLNVWNNVQRYARDGFTSVIHGRYRHEETLATASRAAGPEGAAKYLIVRDLDEARAIGDYIEGRGRRAEFLERFRSAFSPGFDPDRDLERLGLANQTTMLSGESLAIQALLREAFVRKYGEDETQRRFRSFDTICSATQERQDAVTDLLSGRPDVLLVVGGYNSSNTSHLAEIGLKRGVPTFHIDDATCLVSRERIRHQPLGQPKETVAEGWWPAERPLVVGVTAGASTPDRKTGDVVRRLFELHGVNVSDLLAELAAAPDAE